MPPGLRFICARRPAETCRVMRAGSILTYPRQVLLRVPVTADLGRAGRGGQSVPQCVPPARSRLVLDDLDSTATSAHSATKCMGVLLSPASGTQVRTVCSRPSALTAQLSCARNRQGG
jgi:hypothetical protein